jgi:hypothetical protein
MEGVSRRIKFLIVPIPLGLVNFILGAGEGWFLTFLLASGLL